MLEVIYIQILIIILLILLSAFFSSSETAVTSISEPELIKKASEGNLKAIRAQKILKKKELAISAILLGNNLVNILASAMATSIFLKTFGSIGILYSTLSMTTLIFIFAEVLPKIYAIRKSEKLLLEFGALLSVFIWILSPINIIIHQILKLIVNLNVKAKSKFNIDSIRGAIIIADKEGEIKKDNRIMLENILDLKDRDINEVMIHRKDIISINKKNLDVEFLDTILKSPFSRIPVWEKNQENIIGVIHVKDFLKDKIRRKKNNTYKIIQKPWFIPENTSLLEQLNAFRKKKIQIAFVVDEYGVLQGLVTLEDILEEIVGQIEDEHDKPSTNFTLDKNGNILVEGNVSVRDLNRESNLKIPEDEASTIAGLVINFSKRIPEKGESFLINKYLFTIVSRTKTRVTRIMISDSNK
tara:strand:+ start:1992 stop:3233 length:1242 start_codon:yes stop_codon:yes gene_type:complete